MPPVTTRRSPNAVTSPINATLRRAVRLALQEARNERKREKFDTRFELKMDRLASAPLRSEKRIGKLRRKGGRPRREARQTRR